MRIVPWHYAPPQVLPLARLGRLAAPTAGGGGGEGAVFTRSEKPCPMLLVLVSLCYSMVLIRCYA